MHAIKITPNLLFEYQCTSGKFIRLPNRIEKIDSVARIESELFLPELECSNIHKHGITQKSFLVNITELLEFLQCLQCFDAVGWAAGRASGL